MATQRKKRVFTCFASEDLDQVNGLRGLMRNPNHELEAYDESVREPINRRNAGYVKQQIAEKIKRSSVTVCLVGKTTHQSEWVHWEIKKSAREGNAIIAMALKGVEKPRLPALIQQKRIPCHPWDADVLSDLIDQAR